jgi:hypothetical protein
VAEPQLGGSAPVPVPPVAALVPEAGNQHPHLAWLLVPTTFVWVIALLHWGWRILAVYARGDLPRLEPVDAALLGLADLAWAQLFFQLFRLSVLGSAGDVRVSKRLDLWAGNLLALLWMAATAAREGDLVQASLFQRHLDAEAWRQWLAAPMVLLAHPALWLGLVLALAFGALWRYSASCDLEVAMDAATDRGNQPVRRMVLGSLVAWGLVLATSLAFTAHTWGTLPEVVAITSLFAPPAVP